MVFEIKGFPLPPSANALYANVRGIGRVKARKYRVYEAQVQSWALRNPGQLEGLRSLDKSKYLFHVEHVFYFERSSIVSKAGNPIRNDTSNRIKAVDDLISKLIDVDDSRFWSGSYHKLISFENEWVDLKFTAIEADKYLGQE